MRTILLLALAAGGAFVAGWFSVERDGDRTRIEINKSEIRSDARQAIDRGRELLDRREREQRAREHGGYDAANGWPPAGPNPPGTAPPADSRMNQATYPEYYPNGPYAGPSANVPANYVQSSGFPANGPSGQPAYPAGPSPNGNFPNNQYPVHSNQAPHHPGGNYAPGDYRAGGTINGGTTSGGPVDPRWSGAAGPPPWERNR